MLHNVITREQSGLSISNDSGMLHISKLQGGGNNSLSKDLKV